MKIFDIIWPHVGRYPEDQTLRRDLDAIDTASWGDATQTYLDEARRLRDIESERNNSAETKSQIYIAALLAVVPLAISLVEIDALKNAMKFSKWYEVLGMILFVIGMIYGAGAFVSSFRALSVRKFTRIDFEEFRDGGTMPNPVEYLAREIIKSVRCDRRNVNVKVSYVIVTHQLVFRMAIFLVGALVITVFGPKMTEIFQLVKCS